MPIADVSWVTGELALGGCVAPALVPILAGELGIRRVVDLRVEEHDDPEVLRRHGIDFLHLPTDDKCAVAQQHLDEGVAWVEAGLARGDRVLVHCQFGIGRSALLVSCVLVGRGLSPAAALFAVKAAREMVSPSPEQLRALLDWSARRPAAVGATWDELAGIAYRGIAS